jgi:hypothetical protein
MIRAPDSRTLTDDVLSRVSSRRRSLTHGLVGLPLPVAVVFRTGYRQRH